MPFYYRKRKGGVNFSASKRGVRVSPSFGCAIPMTALVLLAMVASACAQGGLAPTNPAGAAATSTAADETPVEVTLEPTDASADTPQPSSDTEPARVKVGETATVTQNGENWATIRVDRVKQVRKYDGPYNFDDVPAKGNVYIELRVTYVAIVDGVDYNPFDWQVFVGGEAVDNSTYVSNGPKPLLSSGTLPKGRKASGYLVYEVGAKGEVLFSYKGNMFSNEAPVFEVVLRAK